jgi:formylglycine-generating enzyme required for sulfatase activity
MNENPEELKRQIEALQAQLANLQGQEAEIKGDGAVAQGDGAKAVGKQGVLIEGSFQGNIYLGEDPEEEEKQLAIYRQVIMRSTSSLPLRGIDVGASDPSQAQKDIGLANVYVDLDTRTQIYEKDLENLRKGKPLSVLSQNPEDLMVKHLAIERSDDEKSPRGENIPLPVLSSVITNPNMVLLGDPGGGKSTFLNFLAHCLAAHALEPEQGWIKHLNGWQAKESDLLPIPVTLRDFARYFSGKTPQKAEPKHLWEFIVSRLKAQKLEFAANAIAKKLEAGKAILLLDGLDEVPTQAQRIFVRDAVQTFAERYEKNRFLVTCRILSYQPPEKNKPDLRLTELPTFEIARFDKEKIDRFVNAWYAELAQIGTILAEDKQGLTAHLAKAVQRPDLKRLAPNPLLLTVMALVHTHKGRLPDARALLYEETVDILLWRWEQIKLGGSEDTPRLRQYLLEAGRTDVDLKRVLWELAFHAHAASQAEDSEGLADIPEHRILKALAALKSDDENPNGDLNWAQNLVNLMKVRAGILLERQPETFTFPHRTFQEYLAGAYLASQIDFATKTAQLTRKDTALWREVALYAAGKLVYVNADVSKALSLVAELCPANAKKGELPWRLAWLGGDVLQEIGLTRARDSENGRDLLKRTQYRLKDLLEGNHLVPSERALAGDTLAKLGDTRFDPAAWSLPKGETLGFIHIPAGEFIMGSNDGRDNEKPQHKLTLPDYWMAKYPVTVAQFRAFTRAADYTDFREEALSDPDNHPVRYVTWYNALAYTEWLNEKLVEMSKEIKAKDAFWAGVTDGKLQVTLPSEAEWEKAARGTDGRTYPWEGDFDPNKVNGSDVGLGTTSTVGCFPAGASPYGLQDMSGNLWEWTRSVYGDYPYPKNDKERKKREDLDAARNTSRVLRGGSFDNLQDNVRCAARVGDGPDYGNSGIGFRLVVSPSSSH